MPLVVILLLAAAVFGIGAVVEGVMWATVAAFAFVLAAAVAAFWLFTEQKSRTSRTAG